MISPITPPPELVQQWFKQAHESADPDNQLSYCDFIATAAAQWGADQELEACCAEVSWFTADKLRAARRPKPPSLREVALDDLRSIELLHKEHKMVACTFNIRRVLEALPND